MSIARIDETLSNAITGVAAGEESIELVKP